MKKILVKIRTSIKLIVLMCIATFLILIAFILLYKPIYAVYLDGELLGYCTDKAKLQNEINEYMETGDGDNSNLAFISIDTMPTYELCLLKRDITTNDAEIFETIKETGIAYYKYYAILDDDEEIVYVSDFETAEAVVEELKDEDSNNIDDISIIEKYETELADFSSEEDAVDSLYEEKVVVVASTSTSSSSSSSSSSSTAIASSGMSTSYVSIGITLIKPITGTITSRFASISRVRTSAHTGLDIAASSGTPIKAAASGTVAFSGWKSNGAGYMVILSHGNGVETYYQHCSALYVSTGDTVSQGDVIAAVGSTGNSTGSHLHLEVRVNGVAYNPQNYVY